VGIFTSALPRVCEEAVIKDGSIGTNSDDGRLTLEVGEIPNRESYVERREDGRLKNVSLVRALLPAGGEGVATIAAVPRATLEES
jgi:hypothetical protein